ncbi:MAG: VOC family protein [Methanothrix sp.]|nr:VOC family protein [Methanothrix sp.]
MATFNAYLNFPGNTEEAFKFYKSVFGGEFTSIQRFGETPVAGQIPAHAKDKLMHIALPIGKGNVLMGTDALESMGHKLTFGNNFNISIEAESKEEAKRLYDALSAGGKVETPIKDEFWGAYFGMFSDKFGVRWMINYTYPKKK